MLSAQEGNLPLVEVARDGSRGYGDDPKRSHGLPPSPKHQSPKLNRRGKPDHSLSKAYRRPKFANSSHSSCPFSRSQGPDCQPRLLTLYGVPLAIAYVPMYNRVAVGLWLIELAVPPRILDDDNALHPGVWYIPNMSLSSLWETREGLAERRITIPVYILPSVALETPRGRDGDGPAATNGRAPLARGNTVG